MNDIPLNSHHACCVYSRMQIVLHPWTAVECADFECAFVTTIWLHSWCSSDMKRRNSITGWYNKEKVPIYLEQFALKILSVSDLQVIINFIVHKWMMNRGCQLGARLGLRAYFSDLWTALHHNQPVKHDIQLAELCPFTMFCGLLAAWLFPMSVSQVGWKKTQIYWRQNMARWPLWGITSWAGLCHRME